jgi:hypothetical protein
MFFNVFKVVGLMDLMFFFVVGACRTRRWERIGDIGGFEMERI